MLRLLFLITLPIILIAQAPRIKIGLDSSSTEWIVSCEDGGTIFGLQNQIIKKWIKVSEFVFGGIAKVEQRS